MSPAEREINEKLDRALEAIYKLQVAVIALGRRAGAFTSNDIWREMQGLEPLRKEEKDV